MKVLKNVEGIEIHEFTERDVVRHKLVQRIILAYEKYEAKNRRPATYQIKKRERN